MKIGSYLIFLLLFYGCFGNERSKDRLFDVYKRCDGIYVEAFLVFGSGAYGSDVHSMYLTDSINFRKFIGTYDTGDQMLFTECVGDSIIITKSTRLRGNNTETINFIKRYSKKDLIRENKFE